MSARIEFKWQNTKPIMKIQRTRDQKKKKEKKITLFDILDLFKAVLYEK